MKGAFSVALVVFSAAAAAIVAAQSSGNTAAAAKPTESARGGQAPIFEVDPFWPKPLPNHWVMGSTIGLSVDDQDHVWVIHRPQSVEDNFKAALSRARPKELAHDYLERDPLSVSPSTPEQAIQRVIERHRATDLTATERLRERSSAKGPRKAAA